MLKLLNIKKIDPYIEANYIPEASNEVGYIKLNTQNREIVDTVLTSYDEKLKIYQGHARSALLKLANGDTLPERYPVVWY